jgi:hypothetical protein
MSGHFTAASPNDFTRDEVESSAFAPTPVYARTANRKRTTARASGGKSLSPAVMIGIPVGLIAAGAVAFLALQPREEIVADASPASPVTSPMALQTGIESPTAPAAAEAAPTEMAATAPTTVNPTPVERTASGRVSGAIPAATPQRRQAEPVRVARARPAPAAAAPSAEASGEDASATVGLPGAPIPYAATTPSGAPAPMFTPSPTTPQSTTVNPAPTMPTTPEAETPVNPDPTAPEATAVP